MIAESTHRRSRTRRARRPGSRRRRLARALLGAALVITGVLVPLEAPALPDSPVQAQDPPNSDPVIEGKAKGCVSPWQEQDINGPVCVLELEACPYDPLKYNGASSPRLKPSINFDHTLVDEGGLLIGIYAGFCEERHFSQIDPTAYNACATHTGTEGFIIRTHVMDRPVDGGNPVVDQVTGEEVVHRLCRIVHPATCEIGAHDDRTRRPDRLVGSHIEPYKCKAVSRQTWSCKDHPGYVRGNAFNTCFKPLDPPDPHPACADGAPKLVAVSCFDYAGTDYASSPACGSFETGATAMKAATNAYWCTFDASLLGVACHPAGQCAAEPKLCLKRASGTGGCNAIADAILCRGLQAKSNSADELRAAGCQPCVLLPFEPPSQQACPAGIVSDPAEPPERQLEDFERVLELETSFYYGARECTAYLGGQGDLEACLERSGACAAPPSGRLHWVSSHSSGLAVVNSPVVLSVEDALTGITRAVGLSRWGRPDRSGIERHEYKYLRAQGESSVVIARWPVPDPKRTFESVYDLVQEARALCFYRGGYRNPLFRVTVEELWPDRREHREVIETLFGEDSLDWWRDLSRMEKRQRTEDRGLRYWPDLRSARGRDKQREHREENLVEEVKCNWSNSEGNYGSQIWCRWTPSHTGYYRLTVAGAWASHQRQRISLRTELRNDYVLPKLKADADERARLSTLLNNLNLKPQDVGLTDALDDYLPMPAVPQGKEGEAPYLTPTAACPTRDLRFVCGGGSESRNYTESDPIGIAVHEIRVATRTPNPRSSPPPS